MNGTCSIVVTIECGKSIFAEIFRFATWIELLVNVDESIFGKFAVGTRGQEKRKSIEKEKSRSILSYQSRKKPACHSRICSSVKFVFAFNI